MYIVSLCVDEIAVSDMSNFVSIILGVIAFSTSVISTLVSFYNLEKSDMINKEQQDALKKILDIQQEIPRTLSRVEVKTDEFVSRSARYFGPQVARTQVSDWENNGERNE